MRIYDVVKEHLRSTYLSSPTTSLSDALRQTAGDETGFQHVKQNHILLSSLPVAVTRLFSPKRNSNTQMLQRAPVAQNQMHANVRQTEDTRGET